jgi:hypothetical protein
LTAEKVTGTDLILTPFDYIIWASGGTVNAQNGKTGKIDFSGTDSATVVQNAINASGVGLVVLQEDIPASTGTITISKSDVSLVCFKNNKKNFATPYFRKLLIGASAVNVRRVAVVGIQFDECEINALAGVDVENVLVDRCQFNNYNQTGRQGIRLTGPGDIENILFSFCGVRVQAANTWFVSFEAKSDANGHIKFDRCLFDNISGFTGIDSIVYRSPGSGVYGHNGTGLVFDSCSFVHIGGTPTGCTIIRLKGGGQDAGPRQLVLNNCHFELQQADADFLFIDNNPNVDSYCSVFVVNPCITVASPPPTRTYRWIVNNNTGSGGTGRFFFGSCLSVIGGRQTLTSSTVWNLGIAGQTDKFKVIISDFLGFNPQGAATVAGLPSVGPYIYTNDDGVYESLYIRGTVTSIVKNGITLFTSTPATVDLAPRESVTLNYTGPQAPVVVKDRK